LIRFANRVAAGFNTISAASAQTPVRVMAGYAATSGLHAVLWTARCAGLFDKNGIKAEVAYIRSSSQWS
jgi:ABC-type nitrate/sulfonate/bicarbonate transport system substrate-binding protein